MMSLCTCATSKADVHEKQVADNLALMHDKAGVPWCDDSRSSLVDICSIQVFAQANSYQISNYDGRTGSMT